MVLFLGDATLNQAGQQIDDISLIIACCGKQRVSGLFKDDSVSLFTPLFTEVFCNVVLLCCCLT